MASEKTQQYQHQVVRMKIVSVVLLHVWMPSSPQCNIILLRVLAIYKSHRSNLSRVAHILQPHESDQDERPTKILLKFLSIIGETF